MKRPCGCYVDKFGKVFAKCAECSGVAARSRQEIKLMDAAIIAERNRKYRKEWRGKLTDGKAMNHKQSEGGP